VGGLLGRVILTVRFLENGQAVKEVQGTKFTV